MTRACDFAIHAAHVFDGERLRRDICVLVEEGRIVDLVPGAAAASNLVRLENDALLAPGFIDLQVNGGGGVLFNDDPTPQTIARIAKAHRQTGTTSFLPTLISDSREKMRAAIAAVRQAISDGQDSVLGIHLEGPFLNTDRKGVHSASHIVTPKADDIELLSSLGEDGATLVTLAPEAVPAGFISELARHNIKISAGHTDAGYDVLTTAIAEGVSGFTHLYNAMSQLQSREPGAVGACLISKQVYAGIIADGFHVAVPSLRITLQAKGASRLFLVSDAMAPLGAEMTSFELFGERINVSKGHLTTASGRLAGALLDMAGAVRFMIEKVGATLEEALTMASATPAAFLSVDNRLGRIAPGLRADFVALDADLKVIDSWVAGKNNSASPAKQLRAKA